MEHVLGQGYQGVKREQFLRDNCEAVEEIGYMKPFSPEEIQSKKDQLSEVAITINDIEISKKEAVQAFNNELKPLETDKKSLLQHIKNKSEHVKENCYKFIDFDSKMVGYYNSEGLLIEARQIRPDEGQRTINIKTGTND